MISLISLCLKQVFVEKEEGDIPQESTEPYYSLVGPLFYLSFNMNTVHIVYMQMDSMNDDEWLTIEEGVRHVVQRSYEAIALNKYVMNMRMKGILCYNFGELWVQLMFSSINTGISTL